ncbi:hypothetical protein [Lysinibacillus sp. BPa_S21]|uniref:hypothetical protein n=1 Tax=Lysinibacillus sp. BPa_S21 TaxID=2932478 RepID=UPI0020137338|nr:hypothetical protein [Lysinibacillus sp. BPa_S21]MCL1694573.1 hypothetical protein [Lysinibacillus sp. BPa_S21]
MPKSVNIGEHLLVEDGAVRLTVVDTKIQKQSWSGSKDEISLCAVGTRSNRFEEQDGELVNSL